MRRTQPDFSSVLPTVVLACLERARRVRRNGGVFGRRGALSKRRLRRCNPSVFRGALAWSSARQFAHHAEPLSRIRAAFVAPETAWSYSAAVSKRLVTARPGC